MPFEAARCPNCGGDLKIDNNSEQCYCNFCGSKIIVRDAIQKYKLELEGKVNVEGISSIRSLLLRGSQSLEEELFKDAISFFDKVINIEPKNSDAWWGKFIALYKEALSISPDKYYAYSMNNEVFDIKEKGLKIEKSFNEVGISNYNLYSNNVGLIPYIDKKCFFSGQRAIEFATDEDKNKYQEEYKIRENEYQKMKEWSEKVIREYLIEKDEVQSSGSKGCLFYLLIIPLVIIHFIIWILDIMSWEVLMGIFAITESVFLILGTINYAKGQEYKLENKYKDQQYYKN